MSSRVDPNDNFGWGPPVNLGPDVNTPAEELNPVYLQNAAGGTGNPYFHRGAGVSADIYSASVTRQGQPLEPAVLGVELTDPTAGETAPTLRTDGREVVFASTRAGGLGGLGLWVSTRPSVAAEWSPAENLAAPLNSTAAEQGPGLSRDG